MAIKTTEELLETIDNMTVKELHEFVKALEEKYEVSAQAAVTVAPGAAPAGGAGAAESEAAPSTVKVTLTNAGQQKVQLIKKIKEITGKGLKECKELVDNLPAVIREGIGEDEAQQLKSQLEEVGAEVEIQ